MVTPDRPAGLSVWEGELYDTIVAHITNETDILDRYGDLAEGSEGHVKFLLELIGEDEARHHRLFEQWAATIRADAAFEDAPEGIPYPVREHDPAALLAAVDALLAVERDDRRQLRHMQGDLKDVRHTTIWPLVLEVMQLDTEKHIKILEYLQAHAAQTAHR
jgi:rubrerythrin